MAKVVRSVSFDPDRDRDLIDYLDSLPRGGASAAIRAALRAHLAGSSGVVTLRHVYEAIVRIEERLDTGIVVSGPADQGEQQERKSGDAPGTEQAAANLDAWSV
ncbi:MAG: hypothetical protein GWN58_20325 [Anaerolineae bacterium]|nr:hypothetical protein [Anaerolineae bacterium]